MACLICGARCRCQKASPGLCCPCHRHKVRRLVQTEFAVESGVSEQDFNASLAKHAAEIREKGPPLPFPETVVNSDMSTTRTGDERHETITTEERDG
jgi:hypothetical protein